MSNQQWEKPDLPQLKPGSLAKQLATYNFADSLCCTQSPFKIILHPVSWWLSHSCQFLRSCVCCKDLGSNGLNNKHSLEEQVLHLASTTSSLAPVRWIKPVWLPRKAKVPLHGGWHRTGTILYQWTWNVKSTMRKDRSSEKQIKPGSSWENGWLPTTSQLHCFALCNLYLGAFYSMVAGDCPQLWFLCSRLT